jgi:hypothetical protein
VGGIAGNTSNGGTISGSTNNGQVTGTDSVAGVGSILGASNHNPILVDNKYLEGTGNAVGGWTYIATDDQAKIYVPDPPNPGNPNLPVVTPNPGNGGGSSAAAPRNPVRYTAPITAFDVPIIGITGPTDQVLPDTNINSQPERIGDLDVPTTVTAETQSNNVLPILLVVLILIVAAALIFRGLRMRRKGAES